MISADISIVLPEIVLAVYAMAALLFGVYTGKDETAPMLTWGTSLVLFAIGAWIAISGEGQATTVGL